eukprot:5309769-Lingulodinium_polyedra.AAC.1
MVNALNSVQGSNMVHACKILPGNLPDDPANLLRVSLREKARRTPRRGDANGYHHICGRILHATMNSSNQSATAS